MLIWKFFILLFCFCVIIQLSVFLGSWLRRVIECKYLLDEYSCMSVSYITPPIQSNNRVCVKDKTSWAGCAYSTRLVKNLSKIIVLAVLFGPSFYVCFILNVYVFFVSVLLSDYVICVANVFFDIFRFFPWFCSWFCLLYCKYENSTKKHCSF